MLFRKVLRNIIFNGKRKGKGTEVVEVVEVEKSFPQHWLLESRCDLVAGSVGGEEQAEVATPPSRPLGCMKLI